MNFFRLDRPTEGRQAPDRDNLQIFKIRHHAGFDAAAPMTLTLTISARKNHLQQDSTTVSSDYRVPGRLFEPATEAAASEVRPLWLSIWEQRLPDVILLLLYLTLIMALFTWQRALVRHSRLFTVLRTICLLITLCFIGFYAQGQLSVVNIFTLLLSLLHGFKIDVFSWTPLFLSFGPSLLSPCFSGAEVYFGDGYVPLR